MFRHSVSRAVGVSGNVAPSYCAVVVGSGCEAATSSSPPPPPPTRPAIFSSPTTLLSWARSLRNNVKARRLLSDFLVTSRDETALRCCVAAVEQHHREQVGAERTTAAPTSATWASCLAICNAAVDACARRAPLKPDPEFAAAPMFSVFAATSPVLWVHALDFFHGLPKSSSNSPSVVGVTQVLLAAAAASASARSGDDGDPPEYERAGHHQHPSPPLPESQRPTSMSGSSRALLRVLDCHMDRVPSSRVGSTMHQVCRAFPLPSADGWSRALALAAVYVARGNDHSRISGALDLAMRMARRFHQKEQQAQRPHGHGPDESEATLRLAPFASVTEPEDAHHGDRHGRDLERRRRADANVDTNQRRMPRHWEHEMRARARSSNINSGGTAANDDNDSNAGGVYSGGAGGGGSRAATRLFLTAVRPNMRHIDHRFCRVALSLIVHGDEVSMDGFLKLAPSSSQQPPHPQQQESRSSTTADDDDGDATTAAPRIANGHLARCLLAPAAANWCRALHCVAALASMSDPVTSSPAAHPSPRSGGSAAIARHERDLCFREIVAYSLLEHQRPSLTSSGALSMAVRVLAPSASSPSSSTSSRDDGADDDGPDAAGVTALPLSSVASPGVPFDQWGESERRYALGLLRCRLLLARCLLQLHVQECSDVAATAASAAAATGNSNAAALSHHEGDSRRHHHQHLVRAEAVARDAYRAIHLDARFASCLQGGGGAARDCRSHVQRLAWLACWTASCRELLPMTRATTSGVAATPAAEGTQHCREQQHQTWVGALRSMAMLSAFGVPLGDIRRHTSSGIRHAVSASDAPSSRVRAAGGDDRLWELVAALHDCR